MINIFCVGNTRRVALFSFPFVFAEAAHAEIAELSQKLYAFYTFVYVCKI